MAPKSTVTHSSWLPRLRQALTKCSAGNMPLARLPSFNSFNSVIVQCTALGVTISSFMCENALPFLRWKVWSILRVGSRSSPEFLLGSLWTRERDALPGRSSPIHSSATFHFLPSVDVSSLILNPFGASSR